MRERLQTVLLVLVLIGVGALLGSFWLEWRDDRLAESPRDAAGDPLEGRVRVEVLNGAGDPGAAREVTMALRERGFDVVYFGNAEAFGHEVTRVLDRVGGDSAARRVADALGVDSVVRAVDPDLYLDATVILGADWHRLPAAAAGGEDAPPD